jgi:hypothetical protein
MQYCGSRFETSEPLTGSKLLFYIRIWIRIRFWKNVVIFFFSKVVDAGDFSLDCKTVNQTAEILVAIQTSITDIQDITDTEDIMDITDICSDRHRGRHNKTDKKNITDNRVIKNVTDIIVVTISSQSGGSYPRSELC